MRRRQGLGDRLNDSITKEHEIGERSADVDSDSLGCFHPISARSPRLAGGAFLPRVFRKGFVFEDRIDLGDRLR